MKEFEGAHTPPCGPPPSNSFLQGSGMFPGYQGPATSKVPGQASFGIATAAHVHGPALLAGRWVSKLRHRLEYISRGRPLRPVELEQDGASCTSGGMSGGPPLMRPRLRAWPATWTHRCSCACTCPVGGHPLQARRFVAAPVRGCSKGLGGRAQVMLVF